MVALDILSMEPIAGVEFIQTQCIYNLDKFEAWLAEAEERVPGEKLHPKGEDEMMASHPVDRGDISFRPGKGVEINSADDEFQLRIRVRVQMLYTVLSGEVGPKEADEPSEVTNNFRLRRARFIFQGHGVGEKLGNRLDAFNVIGHTLNSASISDMSVLPSLLGCHTGMSSM